MAITTSCFSCGQRLHVPDGMAGKKGRCPKCKAVVSIPSVAAPPDDIPLSDDAMSETAVESRETASVDTGTPRRGRGTRGTRVGRGRIGRRSGSRSTNPYAPPASGRADAPGASGSFSKGIRQALRETRPWVLLISILGFIAGGLCVLLVLLGLLGAAATRGAGPAIVFAILVYGGGAALTLTASYFLFTYARRISTFLASDSSRELEAALVAQKSYWKLVGILTLIYLCFLGVAFLFMFAAVMS